MSDEGKQWHFERFELLGNLCQWHDLMHLVVGHEAKMKEFETSGRDDLDVRFVDTDLGVRLYCKAHRRLSERV